MFDRLRNLLRSPEAKASRTARLIAFETGGRARWTPRDYAALTREGFMQQRHRAPRREAGRRERRACVLLRLRGRGRARPRIRCSISSTRPNPRQDGAGLSRGALRLSAARRQRLCRSGDARRRGRQRGARALRAAARPHARGARRRRLAGGLRLHASAAAPCASTQDARPLPPILHLTLVPSARRSLRPGPLEAAAVAVDIHNAAANWNKALLDNAARPSGALVYAAPRGRNALRRASSSG